MREGALLMPESTLAAVDLGSNSFRLQVARVVEDHGGLIELDDAPGPGPGAIVRFVLPKPGEDAIQPAAENGVGAS